MRLRVFDGSHTIGGNKIYVEFDGEGFFLDFGMNFARAGEFLSDFLTERSTRGIHDYLQLGLVPELDIYRSDLTPADVDVSRFYKLPVKGVVVSHAHADHMAHAGLLRADIPLITAPETIVIAKANRDVGFPYLGAEATYFLEREKDRDPRVLIGDTGAVRWRRIHAPDVSEGLVEFMRCSPYSKRPFPEPEILGLEDFLEDSKVEIELLPVDHSIYGASGIIIERDVTVVYTGDIRFHGKYGKKSEEFLKEAKRRGVDVLIIEGTRVTRECEENVSEKEVERRVGKIMQELEGYVFVDFGPRNFERMEGFARAARKAGRELVISKRSAYLLRALSIAGAAVSTDNIAVFQPLGRSKRKKRWEMNVERWYADRLVSVDELRKSPDSYALALNYYDVKHLLDIKPEGGVYIYSASEAFGEEQEFDFLRLNNWLKLFNIDVMGFHMYYDRVLGRPRPIFDREIHSSGHLTKGEIIRVVEYLDPDCIVPVHTEKPEWFLKEFENVKLGEEWLKI